MSAPDRAAAACGIGGSVVLLVGTRLHPMRADPNDPVAAFTEYAADRLWIASHLVQLAGIALIAAALLLLSRRLDATRAGPWSRFAAAGAIASLGVATALQAVDGVALKAMVDTWAAAPEAQKQAAFYAALAVRQVEIGLASTASLLFGLTVIAYGVALIRARIYPAWIGIFALVPGIGSAIAGVLMAYSGFSALAMAVTMPASALLLLWMLGIGVMMWR
jgi:Domain of unknown function (DUF4386)